MQFSFSPAPGIIIVKPYEKEEKSQAFSVIDHEDKPHHGIVMAIGAPYKEGENTIMATASIGDHVLYSINGIEEFKMEHEGNIRARFIVVPFKRIIGIYTK